MDCALAVATDLAIQAGERLLTRAREHTTPSDHRAEGQRGRSRHRGRRDEEKIIRIGLKKNFPDHAFVGKESYGQGTPSNEYLVGDEPT
jgi:fructose-1,6-bisphosphatase/inositol monophosphatase family enzyme